MTKSPNQQFVLEQFQGVLRQLNDDAYAEALGALVDVREAGVVNKELDAHINRLREEPREGIPELRAWLELLVGRLQAFQGDFSQLLGEFIEAEVGLSETEWPARSPESSAPHNKLDLPSLDGFEDLEDMVDFGDFDGSEFDFDLPIADDLVEVENIDRDESGEIFADIHPVDDIDLAAESAAPVVLNDGGGATRSVRDSVVEQDNAAEQEDVAVQEDAASSDSFWGDFDFEEDPPVRDPAGSIDFELIESSTPIEASTADDDAFELRDEIDDTDDTDENTDLDEASSAPALDDDNQTARLSLQDQDRVHRALLGGGELDFFDEINAAVTRSEEDALEESTVEPDEPVWDDEGPELDFSGFEVDDEDDFDFDFGFENPEQKNEALNRAFDAKLGEELDSPGEDEDILGGAFSLEAQDLSEAQEDAGGWGKGFDFGFSDDDEDDSAASRELESTPPSMPAIPRFAEPGEPTSSASKTDEVTSPGDNEAAVEELRTRASLDDDEFFELAESLAGESSAPLIDSWEAPKKNSYRGEPMMVKPRERTPTPRATQRNDALGAEPSGARERQETPNPFAHQEPTGVLESLLDANSPFVLEEISDSEPREDESTADTLMAEAHRLFEAGEFESARDFLSALLARDEVSDATQELVAAVDAALEGVYQAQLGPLRQTPQLDIDMGELASMKLDHRFGFLLSQIDGMSSFEDILELSAMSRVETLDVLAQMLKRGIIRVD